MTKVNGGSLAIKALRKEGVDCIFGVPGGQVSPYFRGCADENVRLIDVRHEQVAALAAEGWARATGKPGVAIGTAGPGVVNLVTGVWNSFESKIPTIIFGGKTALSEFELRSHQHIDSLALMESITKWRSSCYETKRIPEYISMAYRHAISGRPGPVYLEVPQDVLMAEVEEEEVIFPEDYRTSDRPEGDSSMVKKAVELLLNAKRPLVIAGSGIWWSRAEKELQQLIELMKLPLVLVDALARGAVPEDHHLCFGPTRVGTRQADVILLIGARLNAQLNYGRPGLFGTEAKWIQIDIEAEEIGFNRPINVGITGDARAVLSQMIDEAKDRCKGRQELPWVEECREYVRGRQKTLDEEMATDSVPIHPARLCKEIRDFIDRDAIITMDGAGTTVWGAAILKSYEPGQWMDNLPTGLLGVGIPYAMAAKLAKPDKQVILLNGDGAFGFNAMEFQAMAKHNIPVVCVVFNNAGWFMVPDDQRDISQPTLTPARYDKMVEALGGYGETVEKPEDIRPALQRAFASGKPACLNVMVANAPRGARRRPAVQPFRQS